MIAADYETDTHRVGADGNQPEPGVAQDDDDRVAGIAPLGTRNVLVVREDRDFLQLFDVFLLANAVAEERAVPAGIDDKAGLEALTVRGRDDCAFGII